MAKAKWKVQWTVYHTIGGKYRLYKDYKFVAKFASFTDVREYVEWQNGKAS